jgi:hypothetical protein
MKLSKLRLVTSYPPQMKMLAVFKDMEKDIIFKSPVFIIDVYEEKTYDTEEDVKNDSPTTVMSVHVPQIASQDKFNPISDSRAQNLIRFEYDGVNI